LTPATPLLPAAAIWSRTFKVPYSSHPPAAAIWSRTFKVPYSSLLQATVVFYYGFLHIRLGLREAGILPSVCELLGAEVGEALLPLLWASVDGPDSTPHDALGVSGSRQSAAIGADAGTAGGGGTADERAKRQKDVVQLARHVMSLFAKPGQGKAPEAKHGPSASVSRLMEGIYWLLAAAGTRSAAGVVPGGARRLEDAGRRGRTDVAAGMAEAAGLLVALWSAGEVETLRREMAAAAVGAVPGLVRLAVQYAGTSSAQGALTALWRLCLMGPSVCSRILAVTGAEDELDLVRHLREAHGVPALQHGMESDKRPVPVVSSTSATMDDEQMAVAVLRRACCELTLSYDREAFTLRECFGARESASARADDAAEVAAQAIQAAMHEAASSVDTLQGLLSDITERAVGQLSQECERMAAADKRVAGLAGTEASVRGACRLLAGDDPSLRREAAHLLRILSAYPPLLHAAEAAPVLAAALRGGDRPHGAGAAAEALGALLAWESEGAWAAEPEVDSLVVEGAMCLLGGAVEALAAAAKGGAPGGPLDDGTFEKEALEEGARVVRALGLLGPAHRGALVQHPRDPVGLLLTALQAETAQLGAGREAEASPPAARAVALDATAGALHCLCEETEVAARVMRDAAGPLVELVGRLASAGRHVALESVIGCLHRGSARDAEDAVELVLEAGGVQALALLVQKVGLAAGGVGAGLPQATWPDAPLADKTLDKGPLEETLAQQMAQGALLAMAARAGRKARLVGGRTGMRVERMQRAAEALVGLLRGSPRGRVLGGSEARLAVVLEALLADMEQGVLAPTGESDGTAPPLDGPRWPSEGGADGVMGAAEGIGERRLESIVSLLQIGMAEGEGPIKDGEARAVLARVYTALAPRTQVQCIVRGARAELVLLLKLRAVPALVGHLRWVAEMAEAEGARESALAIAELTAKALTSGGDKASHTLEEARMAVRPLVALAQRRGPRGCSGEGVAGLHSLAAVCEELREEMVAENAVTPLVDALRFGRAEERDHAASALRQLLVTAHERGLGVMLTPTTVLALAELLSETAPAGDGIATGCEAAVGALEVCSRRAGNRGVMLANGSAVEALVGVLRPGGACAAPSSTVRASAAQALLNLVGGCPKGDKWGDKGRSPGLPYGEKVGAAEAADQAEGMARGRRTRLGRLLGLGGRRWGPATKEQTRLAEAERTRVSGLVPELVAALTELPQDNGGAEGAVVRGLAGALVGVVYDGCVRHCVAAQWLEENLLWEAPWDVTDVAALVCLVDTDARAASASASSRVLARVLGCLTPHSLARVMRASSAAKVVELIGSGDGLAHRACEAVAAHAEGEAQQLADKAASAQADQVGTVDAVLEAVRALCGALPWSRLGRSAELHVAPSAAVLGELLGALVRILTVARAAKHVEAALQAAAVLLRGRYEMLLPAAREVGALEALLGGLGQPEALGAPALEAGVEAAAGLMKAQAASQKQEAPEEEEEEALEDAEATPRGVGAVTRCVERIGFTLRRASSDEVRMAAAVVVAVVAGSTRGRGALGREEILEPLAALLDSSHAGVRGHAAEALRQVACGSPGSERERGLRGNRKPRPGDAAQGAKYLTGVFLHRRKCQLGKKADAAGDAGDAEMAPLRPLLVQLVMDAQTEWVSSHSNELADTPLANGAEAGPGGAAVAAGASGTPSGSTLAITAVTTAEIRLIQEVVVAGERPGTGSAAPGGWRGLGALDAAYQAGGAMQGVVRLLHAAQAGKMEAEAREAAAEAITGLSVRSMTGLIEAAAAGLLVALAGAGAAAALMLWLQRCAEPGRAGAWLAEVGAALAHLWRKDPGLWTRTREEARRAVAGVVGLIMRDAWGAAGVETATCALADLVGAHHGAARTALEEGAQEPVLQLLGEGGAGPARDAARALAALLHAQCLQARDPVAAAGTEERDQRQSPERLDPGRRSEGADRGAATVEAGDLGEFAGAPAAAFTRLPRGLEVRLTRDQAAALLRLVPQTWDVEAAVAASRVMELASGPIGNVRLFLDGGAIELLSPLVLGGEPIHVAAVSAPGDGAGALLEQAALRALCSLATPTEGPREVTGPPSEGSKGELPAGVSVGAALGGLVRLVGKVRGQMAQEAAGSLLYAAASPGATSDAIARLAALVEQVAYDHMVARAAHADPGGASCPPQPARLPELHESDASAMAAAARCTLIAALVQPVTLAEDETAYNLRLEVGFGVRALGRGSKRALIQRGMLDSLLELVGPAVAEALVDLLELSPERPHAAGAAQYAAALQMLALGDEAVAGLVTHEAAAGLVRALRQEDPEAQQQAAGALRALVDISAGEVRNTVARANACGVLAARVGTGAGLGCRGTCAEALWRLCEGADLLPGARGGALRLAEHGAGWRQLLVDRARPPAAAIQASSGSLEGGEEAMHAAGCCAVMRLLAWVCGEGGEECARDNLCAALDLRVVRPLVLAARDSASGAERRAARESLVRLGEAAGGHAEATQVFPGGMTDGVRVEGGEGVLSELAARHHRARSGEVMRLVNVLAGEDVAGDLGSKRAPPQLEALLEQILYDALRWAGRGAVWPAPSGPEAGADAEYGAAAIAVADPGAGAGAARARVFELEGECAAMGLMELVLEGTEAAQAAAAGALDCLSLGTKVALVEAGGLKALLRLTGLGLAEAVLQLLRGVGSNTFARLGQPIGTTQGPLLTDLVASLCTLVGRDERLVHSAGPAVAATVMLLSVDVDATRAQEQSAAAAKLLCETHPTLRVLVREADAVGPLVELARRGFRFSRQDAVGALARLAADEAGACEMLQKCSAAPVLLELAVGGASPEAQQAAARCVRSCATAEDDRNREALLEAGFPEVLLGLLRAEEAQVREDAGVGLEALAHWRTSEYSEAAAAAAAARTLVEALGCCGPTLATRFRLLAALLRALLADAYVLRRWGRRDQVADVCEAVRGTFPDEAGAEGDADASSVAQEGHVLVGGPTRAERVINLAELVDATSATAPAGPDEILQRCAMEALPHLRLRTLVDVLRLPGDPAAACGEVVPAITHGELPRLQSLEAVLDASIMPLLTVVVRMWARGREGRGLRTVVGMMATHAGRCDTARSALLAEVPRLAGLLEAALRGVEEVDSALRRVSELHHARVKEELLGPQVLGALLRRAGQAGRRTELGALADMAVVLGNASHLPDAEHGLVRCVTVWGEAAWRAHSEAWPLRLDLLTAEALLKLVRADMEEAATVAGLALLGLWAEAEENRYILIKLQAPEMAVAVMIEDGVRPHAQHLAQVLLCGMTRYARATAAMVEAAQEARTLTGAMRALELPSLDSLLQASDGGEPAGASDLGFLLCALLRALYDSRMDYIAEEELREADVGHPVAPRVFQRLQQEGATPAVAAGSEHEVAESEGVPEEEEVPLGPTALEELGRLGLLDGTAAPGGAARASAEGVVQRVRQATRRVRPLLRLLQAGTTAAVLKAARGGMRCLPMELLVAVIEAGALRALVELVGMDLAEVLAYFLAQAGRESRADGAWVGDVARVLGGLAAREAGERPGGRDPTPVQDMAVLALGGVTRLLAVGDERGTAEAAAAVWGLVLGGSPVKIACQRLGVPAQLLGALQGAREAVGRVVEECARALWCVLDLEEDERNKLAEVPVLPLTADTVSTLVRRGRAGTDGGRAAAAGLTRLLVPGSEASLWLPAVAPLVRLLRRGDTSAQREQSAGALRQLAAAAVSSASGRGELDQAAAEAAERGLARVNRAADAAVTEAADLAGACAALEAWTEEARRLQEEVESPEEVEEVPEKDDEWDLDGDEWADEEERPAGQVAGEAQGAAGSSDEVPPDLTTTPVATEPGAGKEAFVLVERALEGELEDAVAHEKQPPAERRRVAAQEAAADAQRELQQSAAAVERLVGSTRERLRGLAQAVVEAVQELVDHAVGSAGEQVEQLQAAVQSALDLLDVRTEELETKGAWGPHLRGAVGDVGQLLKAIASSVDSTVGVELVRTTVEEEALTEVSLLVDALFSRPPDAHPVDQGELRDELKDVGAYTSMHLSALLEQLLWDIMLRGREYVQLQYAALAEELRQAAAGGHLAAPDAGAGAKGKAGGPAKGGAGPGARPSNETARSFEECLEAAPDAHAGALPWWARSAARVGMEGAAAGGGEGATADAAHATPEFAEREDVVSHVMRAVAKASRMEVRVQLLVDAVEHGEELVRRRASGAMASMNPVTHLEVMRAGGLVAVGELLGAAAVPALVHVVRSQFGAAGPEVDRRLSLVADALLLLTRQTERDEYTAVGQVVLHLVPLLVAAVQQPHGLAGGDGEAGGGGGGRTGGDVERWRSAAARGLALLARPNEVIRLAAAGEGGVGALLQMLGLEAADQGAKEHAAVALDSIVPYVVEAHGMDVAVTPITAQYLLGVAAAGTLNARLAALRTVHLIVWQGANQVALMQAGAARVLIRVALEGSQPLRDLAAKVLGRLTPFGSQPLSVWEDGAQSHAARLVKELLVPPPLDSPNAWLRDTDQLELYATLAEILLYDFYQAQMTEPGAAEPGLFDVLQDFVKTEEPPEGEWWADAEHMREAHHQPDPLMFGLVTRLRPGPGSRVPEDQLPEVARLPATSTNRTMSEEVLAGGGVDLGALRRAAVERLTQRLVAPGAEWERKGQHVARGLRALSAGSQAAVLRAGSFCAISTVTGAGAEAGAGVSGAQAGDAFQGGVLGALRGMGARPLAVNLRHALREGDAAAAATSAAPLGALAARGEKEGRAAVALAGAAVPALVEALRGAGGGTGRHAWLTALLRLASGADNVKIAVANSGGCRVLVDILLAAPGAKAEEGGGEAPATELEVAALDADHRDREAAAAVLHVVMQERAGLLYDSMPLTPHLVDVLLRIHRSAAEGGDGGGSRPALGILRQCAHYHRHCVTMLRAGLPQRLCNMLVASEGPPAWPARIAAETLQLLTQTALEHFPEAGAGQGAPPVHRAPVIAAQMTALLLNWTAFVHGARAGAQRRAGGQEKSSSVPSARYQKRRVGVLLEQLVYDAYATCHFPDHCAEDVGGAAAGGDGAATWRPSDEDHQQRVSVVVELVEHGGARLTAEVLPAVHCLAEASKVALLQAGVHAALIAQAGEGAEWYARARHLARLLGASAAAPGEHRGAGVAALARELVRLVGEDLRQPDRVVAALGLVRAALPTIAGLAATPEPSEVTLREAAAAVACACPAAAAPRRWEKPEETVVYNLEAEVAEARAMPALARMLRARPALRAAALETLSAIVPRSQKTAASMVACGATPWLLALLPAASRIDTSGGIRELLQSSTPQAVAATAAAGELVDAAAAFPSSPAFPCEGAVRASSDSQHERGPSGGEDSDVGVGGAAPGTPEEVEAVLELLRSAALDDRSKRAVLEAGAVQALLSLSRAASVSEAGREAAAATVGQLAVYGEPTVWQARGAREVERLTEVVQSQRWDRLTLALSKAERAEGGSRGAAEADATLGSSAGWVLEATLACLLLDMTAAMSAEWGGVKRHDIEEALPRCFESGTPGAAQLEELSSALAQALEAGEETALRGIAVAAQCLSLGTRMGLVDLGAGAALACVAGPAALPPLMRSLQRMAKAGRNEGLRVVGRGLEIAVGVEQPPGGEALPTPAADLLRWLLTQAQGERAEQRAQAAGALRGMAALGEPVTAVALPGGAVQILVACISEDGDASAVSEMRADATTALWRLLDSLPYPTRGLAEGDAMRGHVTVPPAGLDALVRLLLCAEVGAAEAAAGVLGTEACAQGVNRAGVLACGAVEALVQQAQLGCVGVQTQAKAALLALVSSAGADDGETAAVEGAAEEGGMETPALLPAGAGEGEQPSARPMSDRQLAMLQARLQAGAAVEELATLLFEGRGERWAEAGGGDHLAAIMEQLVYDCCDATDVQRRMRQRASTQAQMEADQAEALRREDRVLAWGKAQGWVSRLLDRDAYVAQRTRTNQQAHTAAAAAEMSPARDGDSARVALLAHLVQAAPGHVRDEAADFLRHVAPRTKADVIKGCGGVAPLVRALRAEAAPGLAHLMLRARDDPAAAALLPEAATALAGLAEEHPEGAAAAQVGAALPGVVEALTAWGWGQDGTAGSGAVEVDTAGLATAAEALWSLTLSSSTAKFAAGHAGAVPPLVRALGGRMSEAREEAVGALWSLAMEASNARAMIAEGAATHLIPLLEVGSAAGREAAAGTLELCALAADECKLALLEAGAARSLLRAARRAAPGSRVQAQATSALLACSAWASVSVPSGSRESGLGAPRGSPQAVAALREALREALQHALPSEAQALAPAPLEPVQESLGALVVYATLHVALSVTASAEAEAEAVDNGGWEYVSATERSVAQPVVASDAQAQALRRQAAAELEAARTLLGFATRATAAGSLPVSGGGAPPDTREAGALTEGAGEGGSHREARAGVAAVVRYLPVLALVELTGGEVAAGRQVAALAGRRAVGAFAAELVGTNTVEELQAQRGAERAAAAVVPHVVRVLAHGSAMAKAQAAYTLRALWDTCEELRLSILEAEAVAPLGRLLASAGAAGKEEAAALMWSVSQLSENARQVLTDMGVPASLIGMLSAGGSSMAERQAAVGALWSLALIPSVLDAVVAEGAVPYLVALLASGTAAAREAAAGVLQLAAHCDVHKGPITWAEGAEGLVELVLDEAASGTARDQAALAMQALCMYQGDTSAKLELAAEAARDLLAFLRRGGGGLVEVAPLAQLLVHLARDLVELRSLQLGGSAASAAEVAAWPGYGGSLAVVDRLVQSGAHATRLRAAGCLKALSVRSKVALMAAGRLPELLQYTGAWSVEALVEVLRSRQSYRRGGGGRSLPGSGEASAGGPEHRSSMAATGQHNRDPGGGERGGGAPGLARRCAAALCEAAREDVQVAAMVVGEGWAEEVVEAASGVLERVEDSDGGQHEEAAMVLWRLGCLSAKVLQLVEQRGLTEAVMVGLGIGSAAGAYLREVQTPPSVLWALFTIPALAPLSVAGAPAVTVEDAAGYRSPTVLEPAMHDIMQVLRNGTTVGREAAAWTAVRLCSSNPANRTLFVKRGNLVAVLVELATERQLAQEDATSPTAPSALGAEFAKALMELVRRAQEEHQHQLGVANHLRRWLSRLEGTALRLDASVDETAGEVREVLQAVWSIPIDEEAGQRQKRAELVEVVYSILRCRSESFDQIQ
ncbi:hypothetical protein CYMTET_48699, partial [Cymbomonas tetramitiformis]